MAQAACPLFAFLEEVRTTAQVGNHDTNDPFDRERFLRLLRHVQMVYSSVSELPGSKLLNCLGGENIHGTPKVGVSSAVFSPSGELFLTRRFEDGLWELPNTWVEADESPQQALSREISEELSVHIDVGQVIAVTSRNSGEFGQPYPSCHLLFHCLGTPVPNRASEKTSGSAFFSEFAGIEWSHDNETLAKHARTYWEGSYLDKHRVQ